MAARLPIAVFAAALLLFGQLAASAHSHRDELTRATGECATLAAPQPACALCLLAFHSPASASAPPALENPQPLVEVPQPATSFGYCSLHFGSSLTRAPPTPL